MRFYEVELPGVAAWEHLVDFWNIEIFADYLSVPTSRDKQES